MLSIVAFLLLSVCCGRHVCAADGNFLDDKWPPGRWDRFRDEPRTWPPSKPMDQGLDPTRDPCLKIKCGRHKVCVAEDDKTATCVSQRRVSFKDPSLFLSPASRCDPCPVVHPSPVCGSDGHTYSTKCKLDYQACMSGKKILVKCVGMCPCTTLPQHSNVEKKVCSESDLKAVVLRLREWFRVLHDNGGRRRTKLHKADGKTKLEVGPSPICRDPLGWMFSRLDTDSDLQLDGTETRRLYVDRDEPSCSQAFFASCDVSGDRLVSSSEWCACFQRHTDSPCKVELRSINKKQAGKRLLGQFVPACDEGGFYRSHQCHGSSGQCWCVDRYGNEATGSRTHGPADCGVVLESSGDPGSGDSLFSDDDHDSFGGGGGGGGAKAGAENNNNNDDEDDEDEDDEEDDGATDEYLS